MNHGPVRAAALALVLASSTLAFFAPRPARADPFVVDNPNGTSDAVWDFATPADYALTNAQISGGVASLAPQTTWWNSTTAADFAGPDSEVNIDRARWPGDVALATTSGPSMLLTLQPGATGEDTWLDRANQNMNHGADTTMVLDGRNPQSRPVLRFDLSSIPPGAVIDDAALSLYQSAGVGNPFTGSVYQVTATWAELQATWNDRLTGVPWGGAGGDFDPHAIGQVALDNTAGWRSWNITQLVDLWYRGRLANQGLLLNGPNSGLDSDKTFYTSDYNVDPTRRPRLDIVYRVLGAVGTYVSQVGGPGTTAQWQTISWNPVARSLVSDEFSAAPLDPKWTWTNPPAAYDVSTTRAGHLHIVTATGVDVSGPAFSGHALANDVVGDFTATMKFDANPTANGQKSGLMVLLSPRDWYAVSKVNVAGVQNWRVQSTADAATTNRVDVNSGNPIPGWLRIQRVGTTFTASTSADGLAWTVQDVYTPIYEYPLSVRIAVFAADGLSGVAHTVDVDYVRVVLGNDATVSVSTRIGDVTPVDGTWSGWSAPYPTPAGSAMAGTSRYVEYRLSLSVTYPDHVPVVGDANLSWFRYAPAGTVETNDLVPADLASWGNLTVVQALNGQTILYDYSLNSGGSWTPVVPPADLSAVSTATGRIRFRATFSTADTLVTPTLSEIRLTYTHNLDHFYVSAPSSVSAGAPFSVTVAAKDALNATIASWTGTVALAARLIDGVTPGGGILGTTSLAITSGGTATLATEDYTRAETIRIRASFGASSGLSDAIVVAPGPVTRLAVSPASLTILPFDTQVFAGTAYDAYDNVVPNVSFNWTVGGGVGSVNVSAGPSVLFTASPPPANGTLQMSFGALSATATIEVVSGAPPWIAISSPAAGAHVTGLVPITYANSSDAITVQFEYDAGSGWTVIGSTGVLNGTYPWDTAGLDFVGGAVRAVVTNNRSISNTTVVSPIEVDNTPPTIVLGAIVDDQAGSGTIAISYATAADVARVDFTYFDGAWRSAGSDLTIDGSFVWTPGVPISGVTLRAVAFDDVNLTGWDERQGVGTYVIGPSPPVIAAIPDVHVRVGVSYPLNLTFYVSDPDTPRAALGISTSDAANITANAGPFPSLDILYATASTYDITLWVSDGTDTAWTIVRVIASAQNPPALVAALPAVAFDEDTALLDVLGAPATAFFNDVDGDPLTFTVLDGVRVLSRVNANDTLDLWSAPDWFGGEVIRIRATDPSGGFAEAALPVTVRPVDDAPVLVTAFPAVAFDEDTAANDAFGGNATLHFLDVDGDPLTLAVLGGTNVLSRVNAGGTIDLWASANWSGTETLRIRATDPSGAFVEGTALVTVRAVNDAPILASSLPAIAFDEDTTVANALGGPAAPFFLDREGDPLTIAIVGSVQVLFRINGNGTIDLWSAADWFGAETVQLRASDPSGDFVDAPLAVTVRPVNDAPVLAAIPDRSATEGETLTIDLTPYVTDVDTNASALVVTTDSPLVQVSGLLLTMQAPSDRSEAQFTVTVSDGLAAASQAVRVVIAPPLWNPVVWVVTPLSLAVVIGVFVQRARWRPAKAFLVDERKQLLREFTLDRTCDVTFEQVVGAGALDAVETPVKVAKYHAQTVRGDALAITLLAYGPVTAEQIEFAREMLVNVQDKFEDRVKAHLEEARALDASLAAEQSEIDRARTTLALESQASSDLFNAATTSQARMAEEFEVMAARLEDLNRREAVVQEAQAALAARTRTVETARADLEARVSAVDARESEATQRTRDLDAREAQIAPAEANLAAVRADLDARESAALQRASELQALEASLAAKDAELNESRKALEVQQSAVRDAQAALTANQEALRIERNDFEETTSRLAEEVRVRSQALDEQSRNLQDLQMHLVKEREEFEATREGKLRYMADKDLEIEAKVQSFAEREQAVRAQAEANARQLADLAAREEAYEVEGDRLERLRADLDVRKTAIDDHAQAVDAREQSLHELEARKSEEFRAWEDTMASQQAMLKEQAEAFERESAARTEALNQRRRQVEELASEVTGREQQARAAIEQAMRMEDVVRLREAEAEEKIGTAQRLREETDAIGADQEKKAADLETRENALRSETAQHTEAVARHREAATASEAALSARDSEIARESAEREARAREVEADLARRTEQFEEKALVLFTREEQLSNLKESLERERADVQSLADRLSAREVELQQSVRRHEEQVDRFRAESEAWQQASAAKEASLNAEQERVERESRSLQDTLGARAIELANREKALAAKEAEAAALGLHLDGLRGDLEAKGRDATARSDALTSREAALAGREQEVQARAAQLEESSRRFAAEQDAKRREWESLQEVLRTRDVQSKSEAESRLSQIAAKAADLERKEGGLARESAQLEARRREIAEAAQAAAAREGEAKAAAERVQTRTAELRTLEVEVSRARQSLESDQAAWQPRKAEEMRQLEAMRSAAAEQAQKSEKLLEESQRRLTLAQDAERDAKRKLEELAIQQNEFEARRTELERAERTHEAQAAQLQEASRKLAAREMEVTALAKEAEVRQARVEARSKEIDTAMAEFQTRKSLVDQESVRLGKLSANLGAVRSELEDHEATLQQRANETSAREKAAASKESELKSRERAASSLEKEVAKREAALSERESSLKRRTTEVERMRLEVEGLTAKADEERSAAVALRKEVEDAQAKLDQTRVQTEAQQAEVSKHMKFLQKKAVETLDREEQIRKREEALTEREKILESQFEILENKEKAMEVQREEDSAALQRLGGEVAKLQARLTDAEAGGKPAADVEERNRDIESRLKIIQKKAMELLDREERLRAREEEVRQKAEKLGLNL